MEVNMAFNKKTYGCKISAAPVCLLFLSLYFLLGTGCRNVGSYMNSPESANAAPLKKYILNRKPMLQDQFVIRDETNTPVFNVIGKIFSIGDKLSFRELNGKELVYISQELISLTPRYKIYREKEQIATIVKKITLFKPVYIINIPGQDNYKVVGDFLEYEYTITKKGREVAYISKNFFSWYDSYGVAIVPGEDDILILAAVVVIDLVSQESRDRQS
ncbi:MAG TPA: LURP-one-related family protein, partial [Candidatus Kapabacteria bacterium]|nr:LURP-one-related family protein [Candidatus Kapabacteria bacterium]